MKISKCLFCVLGGSEEDASANVNNLPEIGIDEGVYKIWYSNKEGGYE